MTVRVTIFQAFVDCLTTALAGIATVEKSRDASTQPTPSTLPIVCLYDGGSTFVTRRGAGSKLYALALKCDGHVARTTSAELDDAMDTLYAAIVKAVEDSVKLGERVISIVDETYDPTIEEGANPTGDFALTFVAQYATGNDPAVRG